MIIFLLIIIDFILPIFFGLLSTYFFYDSYHFLNILFPFFIYGLSLIGLSVLLNYYKDYYLINFCEKIKISFTLSFLTIGIQIALYYHLQIPICIALVFVWLAIPVLILFIRYILKRTFRKINDISIYIIGDLYKFNEHEMVTLKSKGFDTYFFESAEHFFSNKAKYINPDKSIIVHNHDNLKQIKKYIPSSLNNISLDEFMENYLRKIYLSKENIFNNIKTYNPYNYFIKRCFDYLAIFIFSPILIISLIGISFIKFKNNINESLIFTQQRHGITRKIFSIYKIRTMYEFSEKKGNTEKNDIRIYSFAKFIREYRIDEFPQIINILFGDMHLIGPRAEWTELSDAYDKNISNYRLRHVVKPGITGWAQVIYPYGENEKDAKQKLMYELYYIKNWSIWLEIEICIKTFFVILDKRGF